MRNQTFLSPSLIPILLLAVDSLTPWASLIVVLELLYQVYFELQISLFWVIFLSLHLHIYRGEMQMLWNLHINSSNKSCGAPLKYMLLMSCNYHRRKSVSLGSPFQQLKNTFTRCNMKPVWVMLEKLLEVLKMMLSKERSQVVNGHPASSSWNHLEAHSINNIICIISSCLFQYESINARVVNRHQLRRIQGKSTSH